MTTERSLAKTPRACGTWPSPVSAQNCASRPESMATGAIFEPQSDGSDLFWLSVRPLELGRNALIRWSPDGAPCETIPAPWNVRTGVNEYGGGAYAVLDGVVWFSHYADGRLYRQEAGSAPAALTPAGPFRYADITVDAARQRLLAIREDFRGVGQDRSVERSELVAIDMRTGACTVLVSGPDFVAGPRLSPGGQHLAWLTWQHPNMPWDNVSLWRARLDEAGVPIAPQAEASSLPQARMQPRWSSDNELLFISDADGWWNLYSWPPGAAAAKQLTRIAGEVGAPAWTFSQRHWDFLDQHQIALAYTANGHWHVATVDRRSGIVIDESAPIALVTSLTVVAGRVWVVAADEQGAAGVYEYRAGQLELRQSGVAERDLAADVPVAQAQGLVVPLPQSEHTRQGEVCYAWFYAPESSNWEPRAQEKPPVIVMFHGGPTASSTPAYSLSRTYWTSRGFAVLDVNYRGSSGRGRAYRHRLYGGYGLLDVEDAVAALRYAAKLGWVDAKRAAITGASAGGYTTLAALAFHDAFAVGINLFGVGDLATFQTYVHKFESHFLRSLIGDWDAQPGLLQARSPLSRLDHIRVPLLTLQGSDDKVVPPRQSRQVMDSVRAKGLPCAYIEFEGEGHGFRREASVARAMSASLSFYGQVFGFEPGDDLEPVRIDNMPQGSR